MHQQRRVTLSTAQDSGPPVDKYKLLMAALATILRGGGKLVTIEEADFDESPRIVAHVIDPVIKNIPSGRIVVDVEAVT